jgi:hypothetical protein
MVETADLRERSAENAQVSANSAISQRKLSSVSVGGSSHRLSQKRALKRTGLAKLAAISAMAKVNFLP